MLPLKPGTLPDVDVRNIIFITRPSLKLMNCIADNVHSIDKRLKNATNKELFLYFLPRTSSHVIATQLKIKAFTAVSFMLANSSAIFFPWIMICFRWNWRTRFGWSIKHFYFPFENSILTICFHLFSELHIEDDPTSIFYVFYQQKRYIHSKNYMAASQRFTAREIIRENCGVYWKWWAKKSYRRMQLAKVPLISLLFWIDQSMWWVPWQRNSRMKDL